MYRYTTVQSLKDYALDGSSEYDTRYRTAIEQVSGIVNGLCGCAFQPKLSTFGVWVGGCDTVKIPSLFRIISIVDTEANEAITDYRMTGRVLTFTNTRPAEVEITALVGRFTATGIGTVVDDNSTQIETAATLQIDDCLIIGDEVMFVSSNPSSGVYGVERAVNGTAQADQTGRAIHRVAIPDGLGFLVLNMAIRLLTTPVNRQNQNLENTGIVTSQIAASVAQYREEFT